mgnify:CR=1 FL=1
MIGRLFAGIDAGGSHCRVRLEDEAGNLLGEGHSGAANLGLGWGGLGLLGQPLWLVPRHDDHPLG